VKYMIRLRFLLKSVFNKKFTEFDKALANAVCLDDGAPDYCKIVAGLSTFPTALPEVVTDYMFDTLKKGE